MGNTKYVVILCDGMADLPVEALGGKTPMMVANKPNMDFLAKRSEVGIVRTVAEGLKPGSDVANLSVMGYDPKKYYSGRSPLEAASIGIKLLDDDIALRCNLVTLSDEEDYSQKRMVDYCAGDISTEEAEEIINTIQKELGNDEFSFYSGVSYRHCLVWHKGTVELGDMTPPHDISGEVIGDYISSHPNAEKLIDMMKKSIDILKDHPVNKKRIAEGKNPASAIWLWGEGKKTILPKFEDMFGIKGTVISAVDLLKGIGKSADMYVPEVEGATGYIDTNFEGKAHATVEALKNGYDFVYAHFEAPDECGHRNEPENKVRSIEMIDSRVLPIILDGLKEYDNYRIMILPDHPTPIVTMTHSSEPVPYLIYRKDNEIYSKVESINEETAKQSGIFIDHGPDIMKRFLSED